MAPTFQPISLLMPLPNDWEQARARATDPSQPVEVMFRLSHKPHPTWVAFFIKAWRIWYDAPVPALFGGSLMITCTPSQLSVFRGMAQAMIAEANTKSAPLIVDEAVLKSMRDRRNQKIYELEQEQATPVTLPHNRDGDRLSEILRQKHHTERVNLLKELACAEMDSVMTRMIDEDLARGLNGPE